MATERESDLSAFIREHHVHFDVTPELTFVGSERRQVGFAVRLWAVHDRGARALPGCPKCHQLLEGLRELATAVCPSDFRPTLAEIEPFDRCLYDSKEVAGTYEIDVTIRLVHRQDYTAGVDHCEERCLKEIRQALRSMGARER